MCPGRNGLYESFSVLMSPLLNVTHNTSLVFNYSQASPGRLSVFLATPTDIQQVLPEEIRDVSDQQVVFNINSSLVKVEFGLFVAMETFAPVFQLLLHIDWDTPS